MADIFIGEKVVKRNGDVGIITSLENDLIYVDFKNRVARFKVNAFEQGFLRYKNEELQKNIVVTTEEPKTINPSIQTQQNSAEKVGKMRSELIIKLSSESTEYGIQFLSASENLSPASIALSVVRKKDQALVQEVFNECDKETELLTSLFQPKMTYLSRHYTSKYSVGFVCKYSNTYVLRVFSRFDYYRINENNIVTVNESMYSEIFRILYLNDKIYYFSKNLSKFKTKYAKLSNHYNKWHSSDSCEGIILNKVFRRCDCGYLDNYIETKDINCCQYAKLLIPALHDNKTEILFKYGRFTSVYRINDIKNYLKDFTSKQIVFACENDVINTLPIIKNHGVNDVGVLKKLELFMKKRIRNENDDFESIYDTLFRVLTQLNFDVSNLITKIINFLKKLKRFDASLYYDYIKILPNEYGITIDDFFDKDYEDRHLLMIRNNKIIHMQKDFQDYALVAQELSWINRIDNGYHIIIPRNVAEFKKEGDIQRICVFSLTYYLDVIDRLSIIVFLRKDPEVPYVTIEYDYETFEVCQARGKYNRNIPPDLYDYIVDLGKRLHHEMLSHR